MNSNGTHKKLLETDVNEFAVSPKGVVYALIGAGLVLEQSTTGAPGTFEQIAPGATDFFLMARDGTVYAKGIDDVLRQNPGGEGGTCDQVVDNNVYDCQLARDGSLYELRNNGDLMHRRANGYWKWIDSNVASFQARKGGGVSYGYDWEHLDMYSPG